MEETNVQPVQESVQTMAQCSAPFDSHRASAQRPVYFAVVLLAQNEAEPGHFHGRADSASVILGPYSSETAARFIHVSAHALGLSNDAGMPRRN